MRGDVGGGRAWIAIHKQMGGNVKEPQGSDDGEQEIEYACDSGLLLGRTQIVSFNDATPCFDSLVRAESLDGIDTTGASRREITGDESEGDEEESNADQHGGPLRCMFGKSAARSLVTP